MNHLTQIIFMSGLLFSASLARAEDIHVTMQPIDNPIGDIVYALYNNATDFQNNTNEYQAGTAPIQQGAVELILTGVAPGTYAFTAFQDEHGTGVLTKNIFGKPTEPFGISNITKTLWSSPSWSDVQFVVQAGQVGANAVQLPILMKLQ
jgi:uncharacterized protein (DUF2141 family)